MTFYFAIEKRLLSAFVLINIICWIDIFKRGLQHSLGWKLSAYNFNNYPIQKCDQECVWVSVHTRHYR